MLRALRSRACSRVVPRWTRRKSTYRVGEGQDEDGETDLVSLVPAHCRRPDQRHRVLADAECAPDGALVSEDHAAVVLPTGRHRAPETAPPHHRRPEGAGSERPQSQDVVPDGRPRLDGPDLHQHRGSARSAELASGLTRCRLGQVADSYADHEHRGSREHGPL